MNFHIKMDDSKINLDMSGTNLKDVLQYCKPKEQLVLVRKFGVLTGKETPLQRIGKDYNLRVRRLMVGNSKYIDMIEDAKTILKENGGILLEDTLISKLYNLKKYVFNKQEMKLILVSDFDISYLKRNRFLNKCFYIDPLFEDFLTNMAIFIQQYFDTRGESIHVYEFIDHLKAEF